MFLFFFYVSCVIKMIMRNGLCVTKKVLQSILPCMSI